MTDGIVKIEHEMPHKRSPYKGASESEINVQYQPYQEMPHEMLQESPPGDVQGESQRAKHSVSTRAKCESFWIQCGPLRELSDYVISVYQKEKEIVVPLSILKGLIECFCKAKHVDIKLEEIECDICGFKYKSSTMKKVAAIFVERDGVMKNLKYDLSDEYNRLNTLKISLKVVY